MKQRYIYIAGKFTAQDRLARIRNIVVGLGHNVVGTWLDEEKGESTDEQRIAYARRDLVEVIQSDLLILDTQDETNTGGREVEYGFARALGREIWIVGPKRNVFHYIADQHFNEWFRALEVLVMDTFTQPDLLREIGS